MKTVNKYIRSTFVQHHNLGLGQRTHEQAWRRTRREKVRFASPFEFSIAIAIATFAAKELLSKHGGEDETPQGRGRHSRVYHQPPQKAAWLVLLISPILLSPSPRVRFGSENLTRILAL